MLSICSWAYWSFAFLLWKNIYSILLPIFKITLKKKPSDLFLAARGLCCRTWTLPGCTEWGLLLVAGLRPPTLVASLSERRLQVLALRRCGTRLSLLPSVWNLPEPGIKPVSPARVGGSTGKSQVVCVFEVELYELFPYVNNNPLSSYYLQIFSPFQ